MRYTRCFSTPKISRLFFFFPFYFVVFFFFTVYPPNISKYMLTISIDTDHTESRISWVGRVLLFCWLMEWTHTLPVWHQRRSLSGFWAISTRAPTRSAGPALLSWQQRMHAMQKRKKQRGKLSHMNNNIQSSPCFFFVFFSAGPGQRSGGGWLTATSPDSAFLLSPPPEKKKFLHHSPVARKMRMQEKTWRRRRRRMWPWAGSSAHTGFLPSRGRTRSMHIWEKGKRWPADLDGGRSCFSKSSIWSAY